MPAPLSMDLRVRIVERYQEDGATVDSVAAQFGVGRASVSRFLRQQRETGHLEPRKLGGGHGSLIADDELDNVHVLVEEKPDRTQEELVDAYEARTEVRVVLVHPGAPSGPPTPSRRFRVVFDFLAETLADP